MTQDSWINRNVVRLLPRGFKQNVPSTPVSSAQDAPELIVVKAASSVFKGRPQVRSTRERLQGTLRQSNEALSPRVLRRILQELQAVIDGRVSEVEGGRRAAALMAWYAGATPPRRLDMWLLMSEMFVADPVKAQAAQAQFAAAPVPAPVAVTGAHSLPHADGAPPLLDLKFVLAAGWRYRTPVVAMALVFAVLGGMVFSTVLGLFFVPVFFLLVRSWVQRRQNKKTPPAPVAPLSPQGDA